MDVILKFRYKPTSSNDFSERYLPVYLVLVYLVVLLFHANYTYGYSLMLLASLFGIGFFGCPPFSCKLHIWIFIDVTCQFIWYWFIWLSYFFMQTTRRMDIH